MHVQTAHYVLVLQCKDKDTELQQYRQTNKTVRQAMSTTQRQRKFIMLTSFQININSNITPETPCSQVALYRLTSSYFNYTMFVIHCEVKKLHHFVFVITLSNLSSFE